MWRTMSAMIFITSLGPFSSSSRAWHKMTVNLR